MAKSLLEFFFFFFFEKERENMSRGGEERGTERIQSRLRAVSAVPNVGLYPTNHETRPKLKLKAQPTEPLRHPPTPVSYSLDPVLAHPLGQEEKTLCSAPSGSFLEWAGLFQLLVWVTFS